MAGNSPFRGIVFCNLGTSKTVLKFVTTVNIVTPYLSPYGYPNDVPVGQKMVEETKNDEHTNVFIPSRNACYLTIASSGFFWGGRLRVPTRRCDLVVPADGGWGRSNYHRPGFKKHLMFQDVTAKYCIYDKVPSLPMSFFVRIKGCVNCCTTTSVHKKRVFTR